MVLTCWVSLMFACFDCLRLCACCACCLQSVEKEVPTDGDCCCSRIEVTIGIVLSNFVLVLPGQHNIGG